MSYCARRTNGLGFDRLAEFPAFAAGRDLKTSILTLKFCPIFNFLTFKQNHYYHFESTMLNLNLKPLLHPSITLLSSPAVRSLHTPISTSQKSESRKQEEEGVIKTKNKKTHSSIHHFTLTQKHLQLNYLPTPQNCNNSWSIGPMAPIPILQFSKEFDFYFIFVRCTSKDVM